METVLNTEAGALDIVNLRHREGVHLPSRQSEGGDLVLYPSFFVSSGFRRADRCRIGSRGLVVMENLQVVQDYD